MNDSFRDLKVRFRRLDDLLSAGGAGNVPFAQAVSQARRALRRGDRSREPSTELETLVRRAEVLAGR